MVSHGAPNESPNVFWSVRYRLARAAGSRSGGVKRGHDTTVPQPRSIEVLRYYGHFLAKTFSERWGSLGHKPLDGSLLFLHNCSFRMPRTDFLLVGLRS